MRNSNVIGLSVFCLVLAGCGVRHEEVVVESPEPVQASSNPVSQSPAADRATQAVAADSPAATPAPRPTAIPVVAEKLKVKSGSGETAFSIKPKDDGAKLVDAGEVELARFNAAAGKVKVKDADDVVLGYIVKSGERFKVEDPSQEVELFKLIPQADGDWKLEDARETLIYKIKLREYGFEIEDDAEHSLYKIKVKGDKTSLRDAADQTVYYTDEPVKPLAFACLGLDVIQDTRLRTALLAAVNGLQ